MYWDFRKMYSMTVVRNDFNWLLMERRMSSGIGDSLCESLCMAAGRSPLTTCTTTDAESITKNKHLLLHWHKLARRETKCSKNVSQRKLNHTAKIYLSKKGIPKPMMAPHFLFKCGRDFKSYLQKENFVNILIACKEYKWTIRTLSIQWIWTRWFSTWRGKAWKKTNGFYTATDIDVV